MRLGIMQPYFFPYLGYYQLISAVDKFIIYDDVNFIRQGWINRNRLLLGGRDFVFSAPLKDASSFKTIDQTELHPRDFPIWKEKFYRTLGQAYGKAPFYSEILPLVQQIFEEENHQFISQLASASIIRISQYLQIPTKFVTTAKVYQNAHLKAQNRIIDLCRKENASEYINAVGGQHLYSSADFARHNIRLRFIENIPVPYPQYQYDFTAGLSILDVLMFNGKDQSRQLLKSFQFTAS